MDQQAKPHQVQQACFGVQALTVGFSPHNERKNKQQYIDHDGWHSVQGMESDRTAVGIVNGVSQQVVCINQHGGNHNHGCVAPSAVVEQECDQRRDDKV